MNFRLTRTSLTRALAAILCSLTFASPVSLFARPDAPDTTAPGQDAPAQPEEETSPEGPPDADAPKKDEAGDRQNQKPAGPGDESSPAAPAASPEGESTRNSSQNGAGQSSDAAPAADRPLSPEELERRRKELDLPHPYGPPEFRYDENHFSLDQNARERFIDRIQWRLTLWTSLNYFNNSDLRALNSRNETSIEETDDRLYFIYSGAEVGFFFPVNPHLDIRLDIWKVGFWGHDQLGGRDNNNDSRDSPAGSNTVNFGNLYFDIHIQKEPRRESRLDLIIGRQPYELGGEIYRDYLFDDQLDSVVLRWYGWLGRLDLLLLDVFASGSDTADVNFVQYLSFDEEKVEGFDGDVNTYRQGLTYRLPIYGDADLGGSHFD
ncbi:MAG: hypothetical protein RIF32_10180, partial [Leptospirales bacterium]